MAFAREQGFWIDNIPWLSLRLGETGMIQVDVRGFYFVGAVFQRLSRLREIDGVSPRTNALVWAEYYVAEFLRSALQFDEAKKIAEKLREEIHNAQDSLSQPSGLFDHEITRIEGLVARFESALAHELKGMMIVYIPQEGMYRIDDLISNAEKALSKEARTKIPDQALTDFREGGRCLAFDLNTAAGFHFCVPWRGS